jgi:hypothetical protein
VNYFQKEDQVTVKEDQVARHVRLRQLPWLMKIRLREAFHFFWFLWPFNFFNILFFCFPTKKRKNKENFVSLFLFSAFVRSGEQEERSIFEFKVKRRKKTGKLSADHLTRTRFNSELAKAITAEARALLYAKHGRVCRDDR